MPMFVKLFQKMLDSSVWLESDSTVRVWVTLLLSMDSDGFCSFASIENLSRRSRVKPSLVAKAIAILESPDKNSTTPDDDGRRIERVQGGWIVLNCRKYRDISNHGDLRKSRLASEQVSASQRKSAQLGLPKDLTPAESTKPALEKEKEKEETKVPEDFNDIEAACGMCSELGITGDKARLAAAEAIGLRRKIRGGGMLPLVASEEIRAEWLKYREDTDGDKFQKGLQGWLSTCNQNLGANKTVREWKVVGRG